MMTKWPELRVRHIDGWYEMDLQKLLSATAEGFIFDTPAEPEPQGYTRRWQQHASGRNQRIWQHQAGEDKDGSLMDWHWWDGVGSDLCGAGAVNPRDGGVFLERITYFRHETKISGQASVGNRGSERHPAPCSVWKPESPGWLIFSNSALVFAALRNRVGLVILPL